jgi:hypothetical protein
MGLVDTVIISQGKCGNAEARCFPAAAQGPTLAGAALVMIVARVP